MRDTHGLKAAGLATIGGIVLWSATACLGGRQEPWDSELYWSAAYPLALVLSGLLGFAFPDRSWRWGALMIVSQIVVLAASASDLSMLPLGLIVLAILALPAVALAQAGARLRRWAAK